VANEDGERNEDEVIGRLAAQLDYALSENALFRQKLSSEVGVDEGESISESETAIQASLAGNLSMKAAYRVKHVSDAPAGSEKTDTETSITLLYGF
jgi:putative salt-induced outer membrane protein YdiY